MKRFLLYLTCVFLIFASPGCKKKSGFDPLIKTQSDFIGTWKGTISAFRNNKLIRQTGNISIYPEAGGNTLSGLIFMNGISYFRQFQFANGTLYFKMICNDQANPNCQNWSLSGYAVFSDEGKIEIKISGNECGTLGDQYISWDGTLVSTQVSADSILYYNFAKTGNSWTYKVILKNGDSWQSAGQIFLSKY